LLESKTASRLLESTCIVSAFWNLKIHPFRLLEYVHNGIISGFRSPKLHHFLLLESKTASFPPDGIHLHCFRQLESKTASFSPAGIQNSIISACTVTRRIVKFRYIHMMTQDDNGSVRENISGMRAGYLHPHYRTSLKSPEIS
jgi:hypothetical protein